MFYKPFPTWSQAAAAEELRLLIDQLLLEAGKKITVAAAAEELRLLIGQLLLEAGTK